MSPSRVAVLLWCALMAVSPRANAQAFQPISARTILASHTKGLTVAAPDDSETWYVFADGSFKDLASGTANADNNAISGSLGLQVSQANEYDLFASVSVAGDAQKATDPLLTLLSPATGSGLRACLLDFKMERKSRRVGALHAYLSVSTGTWRGQSDSAQATVFGAGALLHRDWSKANNDNKTRIDLEAGVATREVMGRIAANPSLRNEILGTRVKSFVGPEAGVSLTVNNFTAGYHFYLLRGAKAPGVTDGESMAAVTFFAPLLKL